eukprot:gene2805-13590_t
MWRGYPGGGDKNNDIQQFGLDPRLVKGLTNMGISRLSWIQEKAFPKIFG